MSVVNCNVFHYIHGILVGHFIVEKLEVKLEQVLVDPDDDFY